MKGAEQEGAVRPAAGFEVRGLTVRYGTGAGAQIALSDITVSIAPGGVTAIIGETGSGKSTLGQALFGSLPAGAAVTGRVLFGDTEITALPHAVLRRRFWGRVWGVVPQMPRDALSPVRRVGSQAADVRRGAGRTPWAAEDYAQLLTSFGFDDPQRVLRSYPHELSGGMLQRVLSAMADCGQPQWILADEPTKGLDPAAWHLAADNLRALHTRRGTSLILITHDVPLAEALADRVIVMHEGRIVETGAAEIWTHPGHPYTRDYLRAQPRCGFQIPESASVSVRETTYGRSSEGTGGAAAETARTAPDAVLEARDVIKNMRDRRTGRPLPVLRGCSLRIAAGDAIGLEGRNGAGKSTLLRALLGLIPADGGAVLWNGRDIRGFSRKEMPAFRRAVQVVAQNPEQAFDPRYTIEESLREVYAIHPVLRAGMDAAALSARIAAGLSSVELAARVLPRRPHELSGGELQRAAICRALLVEPQLLLLDEPTTMLDASIQAQILHLLRRLHAERGLGMLLISHDRLLLDWFAQDIYVLDAGALTRG